MDPMMQQIMQMFNVPPGMGAPGGVPPAPLTPPMPRPAQMPMGTGPLTTGPGMAPTANVNIPSFGAPPMMNPGMGGGQAGGAVGRDPTAAIAQFLGATGARPPGSPGPEGNGMVGARPTGAPMSLAPPAPGPTAAAAAPGAAPTGGMLDGLTKGLAGVSKVTPPETRAAAAPGGGSSGNYNAPDLNTLLKLFVAGSPTMAQLPSLGQLIGR